MFGLPNLVVITLLLMLVKHFLHLQLHRTIRYQTYFLGIVSV